jgi:hypothetical protein
MTIRFLSFSVISLLLAVYACPSQAGDKELRVSYKQIEGECLYEKNWNKVSGYDVSWDIKDLISNRNIDDHSYSFLNYKSITSLKGKLPKLRYFQFIDTDLHSSIDKLSVPISSIKTELSFLNQMKRKLGNNDLQLARLIYETDENTLARLNILNKDVSFKKFSDKEILIPGELTVCKLKINTLMKGSRAVFKSNLFGGVTIKSDETIGVDQGQESFAAELFKRMY